MNALPKIGMIQMTSGPNPEENIAHIERVLPQLASEGVLLAVTPENAIIFGSKEEYLHHAERLGDGKWQSRLSGLARQYRLWLVIGSFPILENNGRLRSTTLVFDDEGQCVATYAKIHLFDVQVTDSYKTYAESTTFDAGEEAMVFDSPLGRIGLSICYDLRFPALYHLLRKMGADIILVPAAFTQVTGEAHWAILTRARAIENQCWIVAVGQTGQHNDGRETFGHSMLISPWGEVTLEMGATPSIACSEIDIALNGVIRRKMPVLEQGKFDSVIK